MNKEDYVSLEVAKLLKEKGFREPCFATYDMELKDEFTLRVGIYRKSKFEHLSRIPSEGLQLQYLAPTLYEAAKWLRKTHDIHIVVSPHYSRKYEIIEYEYRIATYFDFLEKPFKWRKSKEYYEKYEQCLNNSILKALELIEC